MKKEIITKIAKACIYWTVYRPIILGILSVMMYFYGSLTIFFFFSTITWIFADPIILLSGDYIPSWLNSYIMMRLDYDFLIILEIFIFIVGLLIFLLAFIQLIRNEARNKGLYQGGIYRYIRHPQNLAICIMAFPFTLYVPGFNDAGIRFADLVTWVQFFLLVIIFSMWEDKKLSEKFPLEIESYKDKSGFMIPKFFPLNRIHLPSFFSNSLLKYLLILIIYVLCVLGIYIIYLKVPTVIYGF